MNEIYTFLQTIAQVQFPVKGPSGQQIIPVVALNSTTVQQLLNAVFILIGGLSSLFILVGAVRYVTSGGDPSRQKLARETLIYAAIGIVVSLSAFTIVQFVIGKL